jgi:hypothetical protein
VQCPKSDLFLFTSWYQLVNDFLCVRMFNRYRLQVPNTQAGEVLAKSKGVHRRWNMKEAYGKLPGLRIRRLADIRGRHDRTRLQKNQSPTLPGCYAYKCRGHMRGKRYNTLRDLVLTGYLQEVSRRHSKLGNEPDNREKKPGTHNRRRTEC